MINYLFNNKEYFSAVSLLPSTGDKDYKQAPMEAVLTEEDLKKFENLKSGVVHVDFKKLKENQDNTTIKEEIACAGGKCDIV